MGSRTLAGLLESSAARFPDRIAAVDSNGGALTYSALDSASTSLASFLSSHGVRPGDRVGLSAPKNVRTLVSIFGILKAGAAYVPVDAAGPIGRGREILRECAVSAAIVCQRALPMMTDYQTSEVTTLVVDQPSFQMAINVGASLPKAAAAPRELAYIIFTSGSTGAPKGAMITHENVLSFLDWCSSEFQPSEDDRFSNQPPIHFDASVIDIYLAIKHGATVYLISEELGKRPKELARFVASNRLTFWNSTPSALMLLSQQGDLEAHDASSLRIVCFGGEVFPPKALRALQQVWGSADFYNLYGPTEATTACTFARLPKRIPESRTAPYPIGFPCSHVKAVLLDENGRPVDAGSEGLLHIGGPSVFAGYWNRPDETAAAMLDCNGIRWYNTGDVARWDAAEGFTYVGRRDRMVKRRGFRIELGEIERALYLHPNVHEAAVVSIVTDQADVAIAAFVACDGQKLSTVELKTFCSKFLPAYMMPDLFIFPPQLPRTSTDKVDYQSLKRQVSSASVS